MHKRKNKIVPHEPTNYFTKMREKKNQQIILDILKLLKIAAPFFFTNQNEYETLWHASAFNENTIVPELKKNAQGSFSPLFANFLLFIPLLVPTNRVFDFLIEIYVREIHRVAEKIKVSRRPLGVRMRSAENKSKTQPPVQKQKKMKKCCRRKPAMKRSSNSCTKNIKFTRISCKIHKLSL